jgi:peptide/nickel transport system permease protein
MGDAAPTVDQAEAGPREGARASRTARSGKELRLLVTGALAALVVGAGVFGPFFLEYEPMAIDLRARLLPPGTELLDGRVAWFGTDHLGRDVLVQVVHGARVSLLIAFGTVLVAAGVGTCLGIVAGYFGGRSDMIIMRIVDIQLAFPPLLLAIIIAGILGPSIWNVVLSLTVIRWAIFARLVRGIALSIREKEYVEGAKALGVRNVGIMARHVLPNTLNAIVIIATLQIALQMLAEGALSFLGMGVPPPTPSWGGLISHGRDYLDTAWWLSTIPGVAMTAVLLIIGMFGDALRDRLDPRFHG